MENGLGAVLKELSEVAPHQMSLRTKAPPQTRHTYICEAEVSFTYQHHDLPYQWSLKAPS